MLRAEEKELIFHHLMMYWSIIIYLELSSVFGIKGKVFIKKVSHLLFLCRVR